MNVLQLSGMFPRDPNFRQWVGQYTVPPSEVTADEAAEFIRVACQVDSRREFATDYRAEERFHQFIRKPFVAWKERQEEHA